VAATLLRFWQQLSRRRRGQFFLLLLLTLTSAAAEVLTLGALLPFLAVVANPELASRYTGVANLLAWFGASGPNSVLLALTLVFSAGVLTAGIVRVLLAWSSNRYVYMLAHELSVRLYRNMLHQDYAYHTSRNTSTMIAGIQQAQLIAINVLMPTLQSLSSLIIGIGIVAALIMLDKAMSVVAFLALGIVYVQISLVFRKRVKANSQIIARLQAERIQSVQEGLGGIRDVLINATQPAFLARFRSLDAGLQRAQAANTLAGAVPRYGIEAVGMVVVAGLAYYLAVRPGGLGYALPMLGVLVLAAQRMLPLMQIVYNGWTLILGNLGNADVVLKMLETPAPSIYDEAAAMALPFARDIVLRDVSFRYEGSAEHAVRDLNLTIRKGAKVGIIGETGSGKSTLTDLMMGLLHPTSGAIQIDGVPLDAATRRAWQAEIAHVPQAIFLSDGSIAENIAFGIDPSQIDHARVKRAAEQAALARFIEGLPSGYGTLVGERGIRLSGGERQRIGIARALYREARVIFFDEATSALDTDTERAVIESIRNLDPDLTIFIVAHRLTTVEYCDTVVTLRSGEAGLTVREVAHGAGQARRLG
jgi:ABC-type multidrug transport system fused ATPase/permease subunit